MPNAKCEVRSAKCVGALMCVCTELIYYYGVGAEALCICLHTRTDDEPQARYLKQKPVISDKTSANVLSLRHSKKPQPILRVNLVGPRQRRYGFVAACARRLRNLHLNLCGGAPGVSVCCTSSTKSNKMRSATCEMGVAIAIANVDAMPSLYLLSPPLQPPSLLLSSAFSESRTAMSGGQLSSVLASFLSLAD